MSNLNYKQFTLGIEEEYMVLDPITKELAKSRTKDCVRRPKIIEG
jgi:carboxylate-amine ligase